MALFVPMSNTFISPMEIVLLACTCLGLFHATHYNPIPSPAAATLLAKAVATENIYPDVPGASAAHFRRSLKVSRGHQNTSLIGPRTLPLPPAIRSSEGSTPPNSEQELLPAPHSIPHATTPTVSLHVSSSTPLPPSASLPPAPCRKDTPPIYRGYPHVVLGKLHNVDTFFKYSIQISLLECDRVSTL